MDICCGDGMAFGQRDGAFTNCCPSSGMTTFSSAVHDPGYDSGWDPFASLINPNEQFTSSTFSVTVADQGVDTSCYFDQYPVASSFALPHCEKMAHFGWNTPNPESNALGSPDNGREGKNTADSDHSSAIKNGDRKQEKNPDLAADASVDRGSQDEKKRKSQQASIENYIHVRARRGQATNNHSLAERVRREKISERMRMLQELVPGCNKITGKAVMLDEIINYVQSLQRQVEFLSMKLANVNSQLTLDLETLLSKDILHSWDSSRRILQPDSCLNHQGPVLCSSLLQKIPENEVQSTFPCGFDSVSGIHNSGKDEN